MDCQGRKKCRVDWVTSESGGEKRKRGRDCREIDGGQEIKKEEEKEAE
jgi:hypothetical protein